MRNDDDREGEAANAPGLVEIVLLSVPLAIIIVLGAVQVFWRYVLNSPLLWTEELMRLTLVWGTFIGAGIAEFKDRQIRIDLFPQARRNIRLSLSLAAAASAIILGAILVSSGMDFYQATGHDRTTTLGYPRNFFYLAVPVGGVMILIAGIRRLLMNCLDRGE